MDGKNDTNICLKVWYLYYRWGGIWKAHRMGIRIGNFEIQKDSLAAAAPLFASAAKFNYATAIAHYLATITAYPQLKERLHYAGSFKIPHEESDSQHICFAFDEALEAFGVKYIKQNINGNTIDEKNLKNQIKACQDERERIDLLISEYLDDKSVSQTERAIKSRKESLCNLIDDLKGLERIKKVYRQEVLEIESKNTQGRRITENIPQVNEFLNNSGLLHLPANNQNNPVEPLRKKRKQTTVEEENILEELLVYEELPSSVIDEALNRLSTDWNRTKVKAAWKYLEPLRKKRKQTTVEEENILEELLVYEELPSSVIDEALNRLSTDWNRTKVKAAWKYLQECLSTAIFPLNLKFERLREIMPTIIRKALKYNWLIFRINVWFLNLNVMNFSRAYKKPPSKGVKPFTVVGQAVVIEANSIPLQLELANEIYELLSQEVSHLQELYACQLRASCPHHLFQSSFPLLEEKWRKPC
ncbi:hypothetical protein Glove_217g174 [Diversispora epigaea]|uniref:Uncharacterized protein n=1 Tax=Diversispora epigaea TaxID=1348612 RepID=A0A397IQX1_9GLOM|nr:hypothetical protein Glove_217g174 [Diversispora epigaea]